MFLDDSSHESQCGEALTALRSGNEDIPVPGIRLSQSSSPRPFTSSLAYVESTSRLAPRPLGVLLKYVEIVVFGALNRNRNNDCLLQKDRKMIEK